MSSSRPRKATGSFVNDPSAINLMQLTPRTELYHSERSPFTMASHNSKTNFIGDTVITEGPRAVAVTETGEKHSLHLESQVTQVHATVNKINNSNNTNQIEVAPVELSENVSMENTSKSSRRNKTSRRYINQKPRPVFTPRNVPTTTICNDTNESHNVYDTAHVDERDRDRVWENRIRDEPQRSEATSKPTAAIKDAFKEQRTKLANITNVQTQTEVNTTKILRQIQPVAQLPPTSTNTLHLTPPRKYMRESVGDILDMPRRQPLRIVPPKRKKSKNYSELRNIASALTLITVVSWLFSTFFELEGLLELFSAMVRHVQTWFVEKRQPKTRMEMLVEYLHSWWS